MQFDFTKKLFSLIVWRKLPQKLLPEFNNQNSRPTMNLQTWRNTENWLTKQRDKGAKDTAEDQRRNNKLYDNLMKKEQFRRTVTSFK